ncbi:Helicase MOV-10 [Lobulomyces angularis]|nr:Helicase MOV-10 [Lobulomyces angularis]
MSKRKKEEFSLKENVIVPDLQSIILKKSIASDFLAKKLEKVEFCITTQVVNVEFELQDISIEEVIPGGYFHFSPDLGSSEINDKLCVSCGKQLKLFLEFEFNYSGCYNTTFTFEFFANGNTTLIERTVDFIVEEGEESELHKAVKKEKIVIRPPQMSFEPSIKGRAPPRPDFAKMKYLLPHYPYINDDHIENLYQNLLLNEKSADEPINPDNFLSKFKEHLLLEERQMLADIRNYDTHCFDLISRKSNFYEIPCPGIMDDRPCIRYGDKIFISTSQTNETYSGYVCYLEKTSIIVQFSPNFQWDGFPFNLKYKFSRTGLRLGYRALDLLNCCGKEIQCWTFPRNISYNKLDRNLMEEKLSIITNFSPHLNTEQVKAVFSILFNTHGNTPFIINGPPGTGKTSTIVESVKIIYSKNKSCRILVMTPSTRSADLMVERLTTGFQPFSSDNLVRVNTHTRLKTDISPYIKKFCFSENNASYNKNSKYYDVPNLKKNKFNVVVTTLFASSLLYSNGSFDLDEIRGQFSRSFTHVFIDECGQATEPEFWGAVAGLTKPLHRFKYSFSNISTNITSHIELSDNQRLKLLPNLIISGDPKQLGPDIHFPYPVEGSLSRSYLERVINTAPAYRKVRNGFNEEYEHPQNITMLLKNYRSKEAILHIYNKLFYDEKLTAFATNVKEFSRLEWFPSDVDFPIIFHNVDGKEEREGSSTSLFNIEENKVILSYVKFLVFGDKKDAPKGITTKFKKKYERNKSVLHNIKDILTDSKVETMEGLTYSNIGIIAPYRRQVERIKLILQQNDNEDSGSGIGGIKTGLVQDFQGDEREVIIISGVKTSKDNFNLDYFKGFLGNSKKFNVVVSRAKSLLIVVGSVDTLIIDPNWKFLYDLCQKNNTVVNYTDSLGSPKKKKVFQNINEEDGDKEVEVLSELITKKNKKLSYFEKGSLLGHFLEVKWKKLE